MLKITNASGKMIIQIWSMVFSSIWTSVCGDSFLMVSFVFLNESFRYFFWSFWIKFTRLKEMLGLLDLSLFESNFPQMDPYFLPNLIHNINPYSSNAKNTITMQNKAQIWIAFILFDFGAQWSKSVLKKDNEPWNCLWWICHAITYLLIFLYASWIW